MLHFHPASEADIPLLRALAERIWRASYTGMLTAAQIDYMLAWMYSEETLHRELSEGVHWELARLGAQDVGFLSLTLDSGGIAKLNKLYLLPELQGRGLGQEMLARVSTLATARNAREIRLQVNKQNTRAQQAYLRAGFEIVEAATFDIGGGFVMDDFIMARPLP